MFNKDDKTKLREVETVIGPSVKVVGDFNGQGDIVIDGIFEGKLKTSSGVYIGDKAIIKADISAKEGSISGEVVGNISLSGYLEVGATAKIIGDIKASSISVAKGAIINGLISMTTSKEKPEQESNKL